MEKIRQRVNKIPELDLATEVVLTPSYFFGPKSLGGIKYTLKSKTFELCFLHIERNQFKIEMWKLSGQWSKDQAKRYFHSTVTFDKIPAEVQKLFETAKLFGKSI